MQKELYQEHGTMCGEEPNSKLGCSHLKLSSTLFWNGNEKLPRLNNEPSITHSNIHFGYDTYNYFMCYNIFTPKSNT